MAARWCRLYFYFNLCHASQPEGYMSVKLWLISLSLSLPPSYFSSCAYEWLFASLSWRLGPGRKGSPCILPAEKSSSDLVEVVVTSRGRSLFTVGSAAITSTGPACFTNDPQTLDFKANRKLLWDGFWDPALKSDRCILGALQRHTGALAAPKSRFNMHMRFIEMIYSLYKRAAPTPLRVAVEESHGSNLFPWINAPIKGTRLEGNSMKYQCLKVDVPRHWQTRTVQRGGGDNSKQLLFPVKRNLIITHSSINQIRPDGLISDFEWKSCFLLCPRRPAEVSKVGKDVILSGISTAEAHKGRGELLSLSVTQVILPLWSPHGMSTLSVILTIHVYPSGRFNPNLQLLEPTNDLQSPQGVKALRSVTLTRVVHSQPS